MESIALLLVAGVLLVVGGTWLAPRLSVAAPVVLLLVGIGCSYIPGMPTFEIEPEWILAVVLPPILYAAAVNVPITDFRRNVKAIGWLSVVLVAASSVAVGFLLTALIPGLPLAAAIALGAVVSPPDAVAATAIGKRLGLPPRLVTVLEGEGLVNDATALVLLRSAVAAIAGTIGWGHIIGDFFYAVALGTAVGLLIGFVTVWVRSRLDDPTLTTAISFVVPFLAYLPAESLGASGVLATVVAGLVTGFRSAKHLTAQDRISERMNWRTIQLLLENGVFLVMGFQMAAIIDEVQRDRLSVGDAVVIGLIVTGVLVVVRTFFMVPLVAVLRREQSKVGEGIDRVDAVLEKIDNADGVHIPPARAHRARKLVERRRNDLTFLQKEGLGWRGGAVMAWSGMRGVVTLAAAQSLPRDVPMRAELILIAFTVAAVTLLVQGSTLPFVIRLLGVRGIDDETTRQHVTELVHEIVEAGRERVTDPQLRQPNGEPYDPAIVEAVVNRRQQMSEAFIGSFAAELDPFIEQQARLFRLLLEAEQDALLDARASGRYPSHTIEAGQLVIDDDVAHMRIKLID